MTHKVLSIVLLALCACTDKRAKSTAPVERYQLDGVIVQLDPKANVAKIKGQEIKGWMEAMTMEYPLKDPAELASLQVGEHITATIYVQGLNYSIGDIHQVR
jgi:protein SCO1/2